MLREAVYELCIAAIFLRTNFCNILSISTLFTDKLKFITLYKESNTARRASQEDFPEEEEQGQMNK